MALAAIGFAVITTADGFWPLLIIAGVTAACYQPVLPVMESVVLYYRLRIISVLVSTVVIISTPLPNA